MSFRKISLFTFPSILIILSVFFVAVRPSFLTDPNPIAVSIPKGYSTQQISRLLCDKNIIHSPTFFIMLTRITGKAKTFKHGTYLMKKNHYWKNINKLASGQTYKIKVTIPEGWSSYQIAERLKKEGIIEDSELFVQLVKESRSEGMLFPETYFFEPISPPETIIQIMVDTFKKNFTVEFVQRAKVLKMTELQVVTLASIIEREAHLDSERPIISSVFHYRLKRNQPMESCPTVQYALSEGRYWKDPITYKDLRINSPYNTYRRIGLPPGPICNPGKKAIEASLYPVETKFLYFVADGKDGHHFFSEHEKLVQKKLELKRQKKSPNKSR